MPLLDTTVTQSSFPNYLGYPRVQLFVNGKLWKYSFSQNEERWVSVRKSFQDPEKMNVNLGHWKKLHPKFMVKGVATFEPKCQVQSKDGEEESNALPSTAKSLYSAIPIKSSSGDSMDVDEKEKLRRLRISQSNKGNTPWNKGKKHSAETLQLIKERTRLAMQNPKVKVKMKLMNWGHAQSPQTREKIGVGVRLGWQRRREKLMFQETCLFDWQNLIAEASRKGFNGDEELEWDSYTILNERLKQEWLNSIECRKTISKPKGSNRAPKSLEQRRKIAEAIAAKWTDPEYRTRVCSGLAKYHGTPEGAARKLRRKPNDETKSTKTCKKKVSDSEKFAANDMKMKTPQPKLKKRNSPKYKDPLASSKLEMLKSIRAQRVASETKNNNEVLERAKLLIAEAEKAAKALEVAATRSPVARASLLETRKLIAEAIQSIKSIENGELDSRDDVASNHQSHVEKDGETNKEDVNRDYQKGVNGFRSMQPSKGQNRDFNLYYNLTMVEKVDMSYHPPTSIDGYEIPKLDVESYLGKSGIRELVNEHNPKPNGGFRLNGICSPNGAKLQIDEEQMPPMEKTVMKKWVNGRLIEVVEGE